MSRRKGLPPPHRGTTSELRALYPFAVTPPLGARSCYMGQDSSGAAFGFDPWECYANGSVTNPNMVVLGQIGKGKSAFVKSLMWRQYLMGRSCWALDPKGEYGALAAAAGTTPLRLGPGLGLRLNPLDVAQDEAVRVGQGGVGRLPTDPSAAHRRRAELLGALLESSLGRPLQPPERAATEVALASVEGGALPPTLPEVVAALLQPAASAAAALGTDVAGLRNDGRNVALELRRLVHGDLAGMFDGQSSPGAGLGTGMVVLDLSRVYASPALGLLMTCALCWFQNSLDGGPGARRTKRLVVLDEAWAVLAHLGTARWLQAMFKLSRAYGVSNVAVVHRVSDLRAAGDGGSRQERLAEGLLADTETRVVFAQEAAEASRAADLLGLSATEQSLVARLPRGTALWRVGARSYLVRHRLSTRELRLADTDAAMRAEAAPVVDYRVQKGPEMGEGAVSAAETGTAGAAEIGTASAWEEGAARAGEVGVGTGATGQRPVRSGKHFRRAQ